MTVLFNWVLIMDIQKKLIKLFVIGDLLEGIAKGAVYSTINNTCININFRIASEIVLLVYLALVKYWMYSTLLSYLGDIGKWHK